MPLPRNQGQATPRPPPANQNSTRYPTTPASTRGPAPITPSAAPPWRQQTLAQRSRAPNFGLMRSAVNAQASRIDPSMAAAMQNLNINNPSPPSPPSDCYDPSLGPLPPDDPHEAWQGSACPTINTALSTPNVAVFIPTCKCTKRTIDDFKLGQIIALPFHIPNLNPKNKATYPRLALTCEGPVFSKRRLVTILLKHQNVLFCLPLYSFEGQDLACKPDKLKWEYIPVMNKGDTKFRNPGKLQACEVETYDPKRPMKKTSCIQLTGGVKVDPVEHISFVGRMDQASYARMLAFYDRRYEIAKQKAYEPDGPKLNMGEASAVKK
ncbi:hypothetical protein M409DRAFT_49951 [Zasmidium cellare ATCC 36951]|uniref:Uncharacterized protein n=1 Tax=Zasmidium cellare ATCC 36951 TaxID=1080233 RepID=A0A6A6CYD0_ZASCE|nr:uncharacterized protein M409DRAFT_49951 [Zasmidium cellare ATCC 36951]KAF2172227.1 hypothetical protein M409DRAFT_49951 [Zasmidium cellare ATCC 36951]